MDVIVATSKVSDGNMLIAADKSNPKIIENRKRFLLKNGIDINKTTRISTIYEGSDYLRFYQADENQMGAGMFDGDTKTSDAIVVTKPFHAIFLPIADCIGATIFDPNKNVLMLSHLGRHHLEQHGGYESIKYLVDNYGCSPGDLKIWLTPAPGSETYPLFAFNNRSLKDIAYNQFESAGILKENITNNPADTSKDPNYFSHSEFLKGNRPIDGRFAMVAMMTE